MQEHSNSIAQIELPSCCGTGCAVCVLDEAPTVAQTEVCPTAPPHERTQCCNTGCLICVRDYPELLQAEPDAQALRLLEAIETAQQSVGSLNVTKLR